MAQEFSYPKHRIKILLLENVHRAARESLTEAGYSVTEVPRSLPTEDLLEAIEDVHVLGIRSKTKITAEHFARARRLLAVGCFGVGTNQVALDAAAAKGIPVFNAPYSSTRSVAELTLGNVIMLARKASEGSTKLHRGIWEKSAKGCHDIRGKTLGLIGYGHIGQQAGLLSEAVGMNVIFYDQVKRLPLGNAKPVGSLSELLSHSDFVSIHVPAISGGGALIGELELSQMKEGSYLINVSRGSLVDLVALRSALESKHIGGAALDVFTDEPKTNQAEFKCELTGVENVILTPHIGGSTEEAQESIGREVAASFIQYIDNGTTVGAVNFPQVNLPAFPNSHRILHIHKNVPGAAKEINKLVFDLGANINGQYLGTHKDIGYMIMDIDRELSSEVKENISCLPTNIKTRILY